MFEVYKDRNKPQPSPFVFPSDDKSPTQTKCTPKPPIEGLLLLLQYLNPFAYRRPAIMLMVPPTPLLLIPPRRRILPLPLQPPNQLPQEPLIPAIRMSLDQRIRLFPSSKRMSDCEPKTAERVCQSYQTNKSTTSSFNPPISSSHPHKDLVSSGVGTLLVSSALHPISSTILFFSAVIPRKLASFQSLISLK